MSNRIYTAHWDITLFHGTNYTTSFEILSPGREIKLKSIGLVREIRDTPTDDTIPLSTPNQHFLLLIGQFNNKIASSFNFIANPAIFNGDMIQLVDPFQYFFDSFFISERLPMSFEISNFDPVNDRDHKITLFVETEEKAIYI